MRLEKMAIAMHCNLRPTDVAPVVLAFNYEAHNALTYNFKTPTTSFGLGNLDFPLSTDILVIGRHVPYFWPHFYCADVETAISQFQ